MLVFLVEVIENHLCDLQYSQFWLDPIRQRMVLTKLLHLPFYLSIFSLSRKYDLWKLKLLVAMYESSIGDNLLETSLHFTFCAWFLPLWLKDFYYFLKCAGLKNTNRTSTKFHMKKSVRLRQLRSKEGKFILFTIFLLPIHLLHNFPINLSYVLKRAGKKSIGKSSSSSVSAASGDAMVVE